MAGGCSACRKRSFSPLSQFSELYKGLKTVDLNGAGKQPKRCQRQKKRGCFEEAARFAAQWAQIVMPRRCIPSWVIYAPSAAALRRLRSETRLRAQSRAHPSLPLRKTHNNFGAREHCSRALVLSENTEVLHGRSKRLQIVIFVSDAARIRSRFFGKFRGMWEMQNGGGGKNLTKVGDGGILSPSFV